MELRRRVVHAIVRLHDYRTLIPVAATLLVPAASALAQTSVEVSPLRVELIMGAGGTHTQAVTLTNRGAEPVRIRARVQDWFLSKDGTPQFDAQLPEPEISFSASSWIRLAPPEQVIEPGKDGTVRFTTTAPSTAADAGYRAAVMFEFAPAGGEPAAARRSVQFRSRVATLVYVNVGKTAAQVELTDLMSRPGPDRTSIIAVLKNGGRSNVRTSGTMAIRDAGGRTIRTVDVPNVPVLPQSEREVAIVTAAEGQAPLAAGEYRVEVRIDVGRPEVIVGETTLKVPR